MDIISFIPGIGPTASFTPGANTPSPFNVSHTGATNGSSPSTSTNNVAEIYNRLLLQIASVIVTAGLTIDNANWTQLSTAIQTMITSANYLTISQYNTDFTHLNSNNGYQEFPGGRIDQECDVVVGTSGNADITVTYPIAFPTLGKIPTVSVLDNTVSGGNESNFLGLSVISYSNNSCVIGVGRNGGGDRAYTLHIEVTGY